MHRRMSLLGVLLAALPTLLQAQSGNAAVTGVVVDQTGAVVPAAQITLQSKTTNVRQSTSTNTEGRYVITGLIPGEYALAAEAAGFKRLERDGILLRVGDRVALDLTFQVGATAESVTVTAELPLLRTEDAQAGMVIDNRRIQQLPQYNRNPLAFAQLAPNVSGASEQGGHDNDFRMNGGRTGQAEYYIDGMPVTTGYLHNVPPSVPSMESVAEFKVVTNGLAAEYGRLSGGAVILVSKSGTNEFHGSLYEFFRNDKMNANDWNSNRFGRRIGVFHENVYGGTLGGPVRLPKLYNGTDKTFFFLNYEGLRTSSGSNASLASVPTALERQGDFSQSLYNGKATQIYDWTTGRIVDGKLVRDPFPGNRIPASRIDPLSKVFMGYYPEANQAARAGTTAEQNYIYGTTRTSSNARWSGRLDENWTSKHATHFSMNRYNFDSFTPRTFSLLQASGGNWTESTMTSVEHVWSMTPSTIFTIRGGVVRLINWSGSEIDPSIDTAAWPIDSYSRNLIGTTKGRTVSIAMDRGNSSLGGGSTNDTRETNYTTSADLQKLTGKHTLKFGFDHRRYYLNQYSGGNFSVSTNAMTTALNPGDQLNSGHPFASFLLGNPTWGNGNQFAGPASLQTYWGAYAQDDLKLTRKLTLNLGVRWDFEPSRTERFDRQAFWDSSYKWPWQPNAGWSMDQVKSVIGDSSLPDPEWMSKGIYGRVALMGTPEYPGRTLVKDHPYRFSPRLGIAYQIAPQTVVRGSYGINRLTVTGNQHINFAIWNMGFGDSARLAQDGSGDGGLTYGMSFSNPFPGGAGYVPFTRDITQLNKSVMGNWWLSESDRFSQGLEHTVQLGVQREFGAGQNSWVVDVNFTGNYGQNLPFWIGLGEHVLPDAYHKIGQYGSKLLQNVPNPFYGQITNPSSRGGQSIALGNIYQLNPLWQQISTTGDPLGTANYTAGYIQLEHRFGHGFSFLTNYTFAKLMQDSGGVDNSFTQGFPQAGLGVGDVYGIALNDYRHKALFNYSLDLPFGRGRALLGTLQGRAGHALESLVGGWTMAGTTTFRGGVPISVVGTDRLWWDAGQASNGVSERPVWVNRDYNPGVSGHQALEGSAGYTPYVNASSFRKARALPNLLEVGDVGTVIPMRGPGFSQWDFSMLKNFVLGVERVKMQLRFEAQNVLNNMNAGNPGNDFTNPVSFGKISGQNGSPRRVMIAAKITF